jgi:hypothetical protein
MATILRIATGNLVAENTYDDAAAQPVLLRFAAHIGATGTHQQMLQAIVDWLVVQIQSGATEYQFSVERDALREQIYQENRLP